MMIVYLYAKCSTCKNALAFLRERNVTITVKEITIEPPSIVELQKMLQYQKGNVRKLFNTSGLLYKEMTLSEKLDAMPLDAALLLLSKHGMLVKRPFLLADTFGLVGFKQTEWAQMI
jgi:Spx/MgsR family transcriptional regulator